MVKMRLDEWGVWVHAHKPHVAKKTRKLHPRQELIVGRRRVVRQAFFLIRYDPDKKKAVNLFARALGGKIDLTDEILEKAHRVLDAHQGAIMH